MSEKMKMADYKAGKVSMDLIYSDPSFNCRGAISPIDVAELARDIDDHGLQVPIIVQEYIQNEYKYRIVAGHRRHMAHLVLGRKIIPCFFRNDLDEISALALNLTENTNRNPLTFYEESQALKKFADLGLSAEKISKRISKSRGWVQKRMLVHSLPELIQIEVKKKNLTQANVCDLYEMRELGAEAQYEYVRTVKNGKKPNTKGKKNFAKPSPTPNKVRARNADEMKKLMNIVYRHFGAGLATRCLAWTSGNISDKDVLDTMREMCVAQDVTFFEPENGVV